ncbi:MAG: hypothetical protein ACPG5B_06705 [Chitinophagales bacterium]
MQKIGNDHYYDNSAVYTLNNHFAKKARVTLVFKNNKLISQAVKDKLENAQIDFINSVRLLLRLCFSEVKNVDADFEKNVSVLNEYENTLPKTVLNKKLQEKIQKQKLRFCNRVLTARPEGKPLRKKGNKYSRFYAARTWGVNTLDYWFVVLSNATMQNIVYCDDELGLKIDAQIKFMDTIYELFNEPYTIASAIPNGIKPVFEKCLLFLEEKERGGLYV